MDTCMIVICSNRIGLAGRCWSGCGVELRLGPGVPGLDPGFNFAGIDKWTIGAPKLSDWRRDS